jgi:hypothetical protein
MMSEIVPSARASLMATNAASHSLGRVTGALMAPVFYQIGFWGSCLAAVGFNLLAFLALLMLIRWHTSDKR